MYYHHRPGLEAFIYTATAFALIGFAGTLSWLGFVVGGPPGAIVGGGVGFFILVWLACWGLNS